jgi:outer membrane protein assembly factor BamB
MDRRGFLRQGIAMSGLSAAVLISGCASEEESSDSERASETPEPPSVDGQWPMARYDPAGSGATGGDGPRTDPSVTTLFDSRKRDSELDTIPYYPTAAGEYLYAGDRCISIKSGEIVWTNVDIELDYTVDDLIPMIIIGKMIITTGMTDDVRTLLAANAVTGDLLWTHDLADSEYDDDGITPHSLCADESAIYLLSKKGFIYAFSHNGDSLWEIDLTPGCWRSYPPVYSPIFVTNKYLIAHGRIVNKRTQDIITIAGVRGGFDGRCPMADRTGDGHIAGTSKIVGRFKPGGTAYADGNVFSAGASQLDKINIEAGENTWTQDFVSYSDDNDTLEPSKTFEPIIGPVIGKNSVYVYFPGPYCGEQMDSFENYKCVNNLFSVSRETGELQWGSLISAPSFLPIVSENIIYIASSSYHSSLDGDNARLDRVTAISANTGTKLWSVRVDGRIFSTPILSDNKLFVITEDPNNVYIIS